MTESVTATPSATTASASSAVQTASNVADAAATGAERIISSDFETFLKMLTAQLENQDPLNPLESTDFALQLATFSGVEQQVLTNDRLSELSGQITSNSLSNMSSWIGNEVLAEGSVAFEGTPIDLITATAPAAAQAQLVVHRSDGTQVDRFDISPNGGLVNWTGKTSTGAALAWGNYSFTTVSYNEDGTIASEEPVSAYLTVQEVRMENGQPILALAGGATVAASEVRAVRTP